MFLRRIVKFDYFKINMADDTRREIVSLLADRIKSTRYE